MRVVRADHPRTIDGARVIRVAALANGQRDAGPSFRSDEAAPNSADNYEMAHLCATDGST